MAAVEPHLEFSQSHVKLFLPRLSQADVAFLAVTRQGIPVRQTHMAGKLTNVQGADAMACPGASSRQQAVERHCRRSAVAGTASRGDPYSSLQGGFLARTLAHSKSTWPI